MKEILESNLVSAIIALIGVIVSLKWSTSETAKRMEQALKVYESELSRKVFLLKGLIWNLKYFKS